MCVSHTIIRSIRYTSEVRQDKARLGGLLLFERVVGVEKKMKYVETPVGDSWVHNNQEVEIRKREFEDGTVTIAAYEVKFGTVLDGTEKRIDAQAGLDLSEFMEGHLIEQVRVATMRHGRTGESGTKAEIITSSVGSKAKST